MIESDRHLLQTIMGELPVELIDIIFEYVADEGDNKSLSALALASSTILHLIRSRRFFKIRFPRPTTCPVRSAANYSSFPELLTKTPSIGQYVREIIISFRYYDIPDDRSWFCNHPNPHYCDGLTLRRIYNESMNALSLILTGIPHVRILTLLARPRIISWNTFPSSAQSALSSVCLQNTVVSLALEGVSDLPESLLSSILQLQNLTSLTWSRILQNTVDLIPPQAFTVSSLTNLRDLHLSVQSVSDTDPLSEFKLANVASLVLRASAAKIENFACYNWYCDKSKLDILPFFFPLNYILL
jgi:hypothetical protein